MKIEKIFKNIKKNKWQTIFFSLTMILIGILTYIGFLTYKKYLLNQSISKLASEIKQTNSQIKKLKTTEEIKKYLLVTSLEKNYKLIYRSDILKKLLTIYLQINSLGNFKIENFYLNLQSIKIIGTVNHLRTIYSSGGLIDQFNSLPFISSFQIPVYKRINEGYQFNLNAKIKIKNGKNTN